MTIDRWRQRLAAWVRAILSAPELEPGPEPPTIAPQTLHRWAALAETVEEERAPIIVIGGTGCPGSPMRYLALPEPGRTMIE